MQSARPSGTATVETIRFYSIRGDYGFLSNFSRHAIDVDGMRWPTVEHYFQAMKFPPESALRERIRAAAKPSEAKRLAWSQPPRADWEAVRDGTMLTALRAKFTQHLALCAALIATGAAELVEHTSNDDYWADGGDGKGRNRLGQLLMQVRDECHGTAHQPAYGRAQ